MEAANSSVSPSQTRRSLNVSVPRVSWIKTGNPAMVSTYIFLIFTLFDQKNFGITNIIKTQNKK